jgi:tRNA dimethylallyltransferase
MMHKTLIVVGGPTASGKTGLAVQIAKYFNTEVVNADSRQFYKELSIGTAKPTDEELEGVPHHLLGHLSVAEPYTIASYAEAAEKVLEALF